MDKFKPIPYVLKYFDETRKLEGNNEMLSWCAKKQKKTKNKNK